jgi:hypothetical protein
VAIELAVRLLKSFFEAHQYPGRFGQHDFADAIGVIAGVGDDGEPQIDRMFGGKSAGHFLEVHANYRFGAIGQSRMAVKFEDGPANDVDDGSPCPARWRR